jgi:two-component system, LuxR family, response regulator FixJ
MNHPPSVFVVDDDAVFREALVLTLESAALPVTSFADAPSFLATYRSGMSGCLVTDVRMRGMTGLELQSRLIEMQMLIPVVFVSGHGDLAVSATAFKRGAVDFLQKPFAAAPFLQAVSEALARDERQRRIADETSLVTRRYESLSKRESRVMAMVIADWSTKEIAKALCISPRTVDHHREHVMSKMAARSLADLIVMGLLCGVQELSLRALRRPPSAGA